MVQGSPSLPRSGAIDLLAPGEEVHADLLPLEIVELLARLERRFRSRRLALAVRRHEVQADLDAGQRPSFLADTRDLRRDSWKVAKPASQLERGGVDLLVPATPIAIERALESAARMVVVDLEDSSVPDWGCLLRAQRCLAELSRTPREGPALSLRPRGLAADEPHLCVDGQPLCATLFDCVLYLFHNARELRSRGSLLALSPVSFENHLEARLFQDLLEAIEGELDLPAGCVRVMVPIAAFPAAFEMEEILFELRERAAGLCFDPVRYTFSFIECFQGQAACTLPGQPELQSELPFLATCRRLVAESAERRGVQAVGSPARSLIGNGQETHMELSESLLLEKAAEISEGFGASAARHPDLVEPLDELFATGEECDRDGPLSAAGDKKVEAQLALDLTTVPETSVREKDLRHAVHTGIAYLAAYLDGSAMLQLEKEVVVKATAELARALIWHWVEHSACLQDAEVVDVRSVARIIGEERRALQREVAGDSRAEGLLAQAAELFEWLSCAPDFERDLARVVANLGAPTASGLTS